ncbi:MAG TPA: NADH-quinone oxidoreductase subunit N [Sediminibacterium sp.]|nr:NADH-quinone oxidoreductase subunit N [Sediminibacterium sp.]
MLKQIVILLQQELLVTGILLLLLLLKLGKDRKPETLLTWINILLLLNLIAGILPHQEGILFGDGFHTNPLTVLEKNILNLGIWLVSLLSYNWLRQHKHLLEWYMLMVSTLLGMYLMISAGNLLLFYLGLELSTIPLAAAVNFDLSRRRSSEAAMKMIISSAFSSGLLLLGISWIYGSCGTLVIQAIPAHFTGSPLQLFAGVLLVSGFVFKISAVPFHLWTADVYEGAPVPVTAYLSVVSKAAVLFAMMQVLYRVFAFQPGFRQSVAVTLSIASILIGNLFALRQDNIKRFLAFSTVTQVGFMLLAFAAGTQAGQTAVIYFLLVYLFSNLGAFAVVSVVSSATGKENIADYKGFYQQNKQLSWILSIALFSLAGIPPAAGFFGKFFLLMAGAGKGMFWAIAIAALNMVISFYYYLRVVKAIFMDQDGVPLDPVTVSRHSRLAMWICMGGVLLAGVFSQVYDYIYAVVNGQ